LRVRDAVEIHGCVSRRASFRWFPNAGVVVLLRGLLALPLQIDFWGLGLDFRPYDWTGSALQNRSQMNYLKNYLGLLNFVSLHEGRLSAVTTCSVTVAGWKWHAKVAA
jgi:hypothetical protein